MEKERRKRHFTCIGALIDASVLSAIQRFWWTRDVEVLFDVIQIPRGEAYPLAVDEPTLPKHDVRVVEAQPKLRYPDHNPVACRRQAAINDEQTASTVA